MDNKEVLAVMEQQRKLAIDALREVVTSAMMHIEMLETDMPDRGTHTGHSIAQQESQTLGFAIAHAIRHDILLRVLRSDI